MTPTGADSVKQYFGDSVTHLYLPYDLPVSVKHFISVIEPSILIVMETELWPNLFHYCHEKNIPVIVVNARMSEKSASGSHRLIDHSPCQIVHSYCSLSMLRPHPVAID